MSEDYARTRRDEARSGLQRGFILALALIVSAIFFWMIKGFLAPLFLAAMFAFLLDPVQRFFTFVFAGRRTMAAGVVLVLAILLLLIPLALIVGLVIDQAVDIAQRASPWVQQQIAAFRESGIEGLPEWIPFRDEVIRYQTDIMAQFGQAAGNIGSFIVSNLTSATGNTLALFLDVIVLLFALFYFLSQGPALADGALSLMPLPQADRERLAERIMSVIRATVKGTFVIALIQGVLTGLALYVAGVPGALFWTVVTIVLAIIPMIGPPLVWGPASLWLFLNGNVLEGALLAAWGAGVVGVIDNLLRPALVGKDAKMSDLMVLISTLGGLTLFGAVGIIIGPVVAALFSAVWYIYRSSYAPLLNEEEPPAKPEPGGG